MYEVIVRKGHRKADNGKGERTLIYSLMKTCVVVEFYFTPYVVDVIT